jgi:2-oxoglutarate ferredoxin oxidoreductase subunit beta
MMKPSQSQHPLDPFFRTGITPFVWCSGCGIGIVIHAFLQALDEVNIDDNNVHVVSGFGCSGKIAEYVKAPSTAVTDGYLIRHAVDLSVNNPSSRIVVYSNNADFLIAGSKDFRENGEKGRDLLIIHINNFMYIVTENGVVPTTPFIRTSDDKDIELPYNVPLLAKTCGAKYVARWTPFHAGWLRYSFIEALSKEGLRLIEVISPCLLYHADDRIIADSVEGMKFYNDHSVMKHGESVENLDIRAGKEIIIGKFVDEA